MPRKLLFLTYPEFGQSNVHLAVIAALQASHPDIELHLASFKSLRNRTPAGVTFHPIIGKALPEYFDVTKVEAYDYVSTKPGFWGYIAASLRLIPLVIPGTADEYLETAQSVFALIEDLQPSLTLLDPFFCAGEDGLARSGSLYVKLSPNTVKEAAAAEQGPGIFSFPTTGLGYKYPLSWTDYVLNIIALLWTGLYTLKINRKYQSVNAARNRAGYPGALPIFADRSVPVLCMSHPDLDFPLVLPPDIVTCGPILQPSCLVQEEDPELSAWLDSGRRTVLIAMGSHWKMTEEYYTNMLISVRVLLEKREDVQVLWKLQTFGDIQIDTTVNEKRLRIVDWLKVNPTSVLTSGKVCCVVNHGGSNSYHEALSAGVPQVILSPWFDCHDFAVRAEWLGIGLWGNRNAAPQCEQKEVTAALLKVVDSERMTSRAKECAKIVNTPRASGSIPGLKGGKDLTEGRDIAAEWIWQRLEEL